MASVFSKLLPGQLRFRSRCSGGPESVRPAHSFRIRSIDESVRSDWSPLRRLRHQAVNSPCLPGSHTASLTTATFNDHRPPAFLHEKTVPKRSWCRQQQFGPGSGDPNSDHYASDAEELTLTVTMSRSWYCWWVSDVAI